jgi:transposase
MTYPAKFRKQAFHVKEKKNLTIVETAERFGVGVASIARWKMGM